MELQEPRTAHLIVARHTLHNAQVHRSVGEVWTTTTPLNFSTVPYNSHVDTTPIGCYNPQIVEILPSYRYTISVL